MNSKVIRAIEYGSSW